MNLFSNFGTAETCKHMSSGQSADFLCLIIFEVHINCDFHRLSHILRSGSLKSRSILYLNGHSCSRIFFSPYRGGNGMQ